MLSCLVSESSTLPAVRKFTVPGLLLLFSIYESFVTDVPPFRIVTFGVPLAVKIFPWWYSLFITNTYSAFVWIFSERSPFCILNLI